MTRPSMACGRPDIYHFFVGRRAAPFVMLVLMACGPADTPLGPRIEEDTQAPTAVVEVVDTAGRPIADGRADFGEAFSLDGARSTDAGGGRIAEYAWSLPGGSVVETVDPQLAVWDLVDDPFSPGGHTFGLTVTDDSGNESALVELTVTVTDVQPPTAVLAVLDASGSVDADGRIDFGTAFSLDGSSSTDVGGRIVSYDWVLPDGSVVETAESQLAVSDPFPLGVHTFGLTVADDSDNESALVEVTVTVVDSQAPTAVADVLDASGAVDAGRRIDIGAAFSLDGSRSTDVGGRIVAWEWSLPQGTIVRLDRPTFAVTEILDDPFARGVHTFGLTVTDDSGNESTPVEVTVTVADLQAPTAVADVLDASGTVDADGRIDFGAAFSLDGSRSTDVGGRIVVWEWSLPDGTTVRLDRPTFAVTELLDDPFQAGLHLFGLMVTDDSGNRSTPVEVAVTVLEPDTQAPTAVLSVIDARGRPLVDDIRFGSAFSLSGAGSLDVGGEITRYVWHLPDGRTVQTATGTLAVTEVVSDPFRIGQHTFGLVVVDGSGNESARAAVTVTIVS